MVTIMYPAVYVQVTSCVSAQPVLAQQGVSLSNSPVLPIPQQPNPIPIFVE